MVAPSTLVGVTSRTGICAAPLFVPILFDMGLCRVPLRIDRLLTMAIREVGMVRGVFVMFGGCLVMGYGLF